MRGRLVASEGRLALALAALAGAAATALSASAGWFLASAALVGAMGPAAAHAFNILAPSAAVRFFALTRTLARYAERVVGHDAVLANSAHLRPALFRGLARGRGGDLDAAGDLDARLMRDIEATESEIVQVRAPMAAALGALAVSLAVLAFVDVTAMLAALAGFVVIGWGAPALARQLGRRASGELVARRAELRALSVSLASGLAEIRTLGAERRVGAQLEALAARIAEEERRIAQAAALGGVLTAMAAAGAVLLILIAAHGAGADLAASVAGVLGALALADQAAPLSEAGARAMERKAALARLEPLAASDAPAAAAAPSPPWDIDVQNFVVLAASGAPLGPPVSLIVRQGEIAVLVGRSGAGKSSLLRAVLGWPVRAEGGVRIGGLAPEARPDMASLFAYAPQSVDLLPGSVRDNLVLARPDADEAEMHAALHAAYIEDVVDAAGGLDAKIDALGDGFSGGEARRLALARAFVSQRPILLLDEPSAGLDAETERAIVASVCAYVGAAPERLALIVTHRPAFIGIANKVIDLDGAL